MVERAIHFLMLHTIWKARHFMTANALSTESPDDLEALQESVREQRDVLLEKLVEYALGTQSNTLLEVRRAAFEKLLTLYILFSAPPSQLPTDDSTQQQSPLAPLGITMTDEIQYRCAGFVQAEVERYAEELELENPEAGRRNDESGSESGMRGDDAGKSNHDADDRPLPPTVPSRSLVSSPSSCPN